MEKDIHVGFAFITENKEILTISVSANPHLSAVELVATLKALIRIVKASSHRETCLHDIAEDIAADTKERREETNGTVN